MSRAELVARNHGWDHADDIAATGLDDWFRRNVARLGSDPLAGECLRRLGGTAFKSFALMGALARASGEPR